MCPRDARSCISFHDSCSQFHVALRVYPANLLLLVKGLPQYLKYPQYSFPAGEVVAQYNSRSMQQQELLREFTPACYLTTEDERRIKSHAEFDCNTACRYNSRGDRGGTVVKVLYYKSEGRWFDSRLCQWNFSLT